MNSSSNSSFHNLVDKYFR